MNGLKYVKSTLTKSIGGREPRVSLESPHKHASTNRDHLLQVTIVNGRHIIGIAHYTPSMFSIGLESSLRYQTHVTDGDRHTLSYWHGRTLRYEMTGSSD